MVQPLQGFLHHYCTRHAHAENLNYMHREFNGRVRRSRTERPFTVGLRRTPDHDAIQTLTMRVHVLQHTLTHSAMARIVYNLYSCFTGFSSVRTA